MIRKTTILFAVIFLSFALFIGNAVACHDCDFAYTVGSFNSTGEQNLFGWDETPWLFLNLPEVDLNVSNSWWTAPSGLTYFVGSYPSFDQQIWLSLDEGKDSSGNSITWLDAKEPGKCAVKAAYFYADGTTSCIDKSKFTAAVVPEPINYILFLSGTATLVVGSFWKHKKRQYIIY